MNPAVSVPQSIPAKPWVKWVIALTVALGAVLEMIDTTIVNVALADMQASLGATLSEIGWVITSYSIANVIVLPLSAWLGDRFGKKRYFVFCLAAFTASSVLCGLSTSLPMLIFARVLQGLGGGGLLAKAQAILFETFPKEEHGKAQALFGIGVIAGPAIGPVLGGYLVTNYSWPMIFFVNLPFGIAAVFLAQTFLPPDLEPRKVLAKVDWAGIGLLIIGLGSLQWLLEEGNADDWFESGEITMLAVLAVVGLGLFIWRELTTEHPAVDLRVLRHRQLAAGSLFFAVLGMGLFGATFALPIFTQNVLQYTAEQTGTLMLPGALASAMMMPVMGKLVNKYDARLLVSIGAIIFVITMFALEGINPQTSRESFFWPLIGRGVGISFMFMPLTTASLGSLPRKDLAAASAFSNLARQMGGSIGIAILATMLARRQAFHRSNLLEHVTALDPAFQIRYNAMVQSFTTKGADLATAQKRAMAAIDGIVNGQAAIMSFGDVFHVVGIAFILALPLVFLLGRGGRPMSGGH